jgi:hypothetical protein
MGNVAGCMVLLGRLWARALANLSLPHCALMRLMAIKLYERERGSTILFYVATQLYVLLGKAVNLPGKFYKLSRKVLKSPVSIDRGLVVGLCAFALIVRIACG